MTVEHESDWKKKQTNKTKQKRPYELSQEELSRWLISPCLT